MYFKRLEIFGFKSFAEKTVLEFQPGTSIIVGPNGCGKSNVFDSIRWVLGEQSAKDLRGSSMTDVIFNGTDTRPALGFAEVSVSFSNESRVLPFEHDEVTVTRRLFRSGESEYLLNKNVCRLKDIIELFLGTGVGAESYSMIQQGKVDLIVSARPEDRREIFDEAAGITKYKSKKKEALSKLKETEENLLRINDIVVEVKRQIGSIERQAKKAQKYKEEFEQLKGLELVMAQFNVGAFAKELNDVLQKSKEFEVKDQELNVALQEINSQLEHEMAQIEEIDEQLGVLKSRHMRIENDVDMNTRQITFNEERMNTIDQSVEQTEIDKVAAMNRCKANQIKIEEIKGILSTFAQTLVEAKNRWQQKKEELGVLVHAIEAATQSIQTYTQEQISLNAQEVRIKNQLTDHLKRNMDLLGRRTRLQQDNTKITGEKTEVEQKFEAINGGIVSLDHMLQENWTNLNAERQLLEEVRLNQAAADNEIDDLEKTNVFLTSQKEFIAKMQVQYQDSPDPIVEGRFISSVRPKELQTGIIGKIKEIHELPANETGSIMFEIVYETKYVELDLAHMDGRILEVAEKLNQAVVRKESLDQQLYRQQQNVDVVLKNIQDLEKKLSVLQSQKNDIELETGKIVGELDLIVSEFAQVESDLVILKVEEEKLNETLQGIIGQIRRCQEDVTSKREAIAQKHKDREALNVQVVQLESEVQAAGQQQKSLEENLSVYVQGLDRDLADISRFDMVIEESAAKKQQLSEQSIQLTTLIETLRTTMAQVAAQLNDENARKQEMLSRLNGVRQQAKGYEEEIINSKTARHQLDMRAQEIQFHQRSLKDRLMQSYRIDLDNLPVSEVPQSIVEQNLEGYLDQVQEESALIMPEDLQQVVVPEPEVDYEELGRQIEALKKKCEAYGAVNLVAIEEFDELKQRFEFLTKQQSDLLTARESLMQTIQKINRTTRQMFTDTFTRVNEEFQIHFRMLFGGGEAQLILLDPENALESGIDIVARPPGKKPQHISLLSGGEKTMTAIALIFGVFKVNPSPFCVLDEIDAALDESNVTRFSNLLKEFAKIAQFIVISHNKKTMENADIMYGVTMPERGISRIVSVNFNKTHKPEAPVVLDVKPAVVEV